MDFIIKATNAMMYFAQKSDEWSIIDTRSSDEYMGWASAGQIGGHVPYAKLFSASWLDECWSDPEHPERHEADLRLQLESQRITPEKSVIVYDADGSTCEKVCDYLEANGIRKIFYYDLREWPGDLYRYPGYRLIAPAWLVNEYINGRDENGEPIGDVRIFEVGWKEPSAKYVEAHIPGAIHIDTNEVEMEPDWEMIPDEDLIEFACRNGVSPDTKVVLYGNTPLNHGAANKFATVFRYMGVKNVKLLNGTIKEWIRTGYPTEKGVNAKRPLAERPDFSFDRRHIVHLDDARRLQADPSLGSLIDTRGWKEYIGEESGYEDLDRAGRIKGSVWCSYPHFFAAPDLKMGNLEVMFNFFQTAGVDVSKTAAFFCGQSSWGASLPKLYMDVAGMTTSAIYEGGWQEWSLYPEDPCETGIPEKYIGFDPDRFDPALFASSEKCHVL